MLGVFERNLRSSSDGVELYYTELCRCDSGFELSGQAETSYCPVGYGVG